MQKSSMAENDTTRIVGFAFQIALAMLGAVLLFLRGALPDPDYPYFLPLLCFGLAPAVGLLFEHFLGEKRLVPEREVWIAILIGGIVGLVLIVLSLCNVLGPEIGAIGALLPGAFGFFYERYRRARVLSKQEGQKKREAYLLASLLLFLALGVLSFFFLAKNQMGFGLIWLFLPLSGAARLGRDLR